MSAIEVHSSEPPIGEPFIFSADQWDSMGGPVIAMTEEAFGLTPTDPLLGETDEVVVAQNIQAAFLDRMNTVAMLRPQVGEGAFGYSLAVPIGAMDPSRTSESSETAYIYFTVVDSSLRGRGLVGPLTDSLLESLFKKGFRYVERDSKIESGYADSVSKNYEGAIIESHDHTKWPDVGPERFFRIDIQKYLENKDKKSSSESSE